MRGLFLIVTTLFITAWSDPADAILVLKNGKQIITHGAYERQDNAVVFRTQADGPLQKLPVNQIDFLSTDRATTDFRKNIVVLKNGKKLFTQGPFEVKGQFIVFQLEEDGALSQLPNRAVNLPASRQESADYKNRMIARVAKINKPVPKPPKDPTLTDLAEYVSQSNDDTDAPPPVISLEDDSLEEYARNNPPTVNEQVAWVPPSGDANDISRYQEQSADFSKTYQSLKAKLDEVNSNIDAAEQSLIAAEQNSALGDDSTGAYFNLMERYEKQLEALRESKADIEKQMTDLDREARRAGIPGYKRIRTNDPN